MPHEDKFVERKGKFKIVLQALNKILIYGTKEQLNLKWPAPLPLIKISHTNQHPPGQVPSRLNAKTSTYTQNYQNSL